jgi:hypothetical protein
MSTFDDDTNLEFFEEPETVESPETSRRRMRRPRPGGPRRPSTPPPGAVALARLAGFVALAIVVIVGLVFWVGSCQGKSKHDEYASYMDDVRPIAQDSAAPGGQFANVFGTVNLTLAGLQSKLQQWSQQQQRLYDEALHLTPPGPLQAANQQVLATLQLRAIGLTALANTLATSGSKSADVEKVRLANQAKILTASDLVWANLFRLPATEIMRRQGVTGVVAPASRMITNPEVISPRAFGTVYSRLAASNTSGPVTGLRGSALNKTEAVSGSSVTPLSESTPTTVDVSSNLAFRVTFTNAGNYPEVKVPVTLTVSVFGRQVLPQPKRKLVLGPIEKGHTATVDFGNLQLPTSAFGNNASVHVVVGKVPGEANLDNNSATYKVFFSLTGG